MKIIILAGGAGKRLWPISRTKNPKQLQPFFAEKTLLRTTVSRMLKGFKKEDIYISTGRVSQALIKKDLGKILPNNHYFIEPLKRDTAGAIGLAAYLIAKENPDAIIATVNSDHYIKNIPEYLRVMKVAEKAVAKHPDHLLLVGIKPTYPETGYGYIKLNRVLEKQGRDEIFSVSAFKEKPDLKTAQKYLKSKSYLWNPAFFVFKASTMIKLFEKHLPHEHKILSSIQKDPKKLNALFPELAKISIDYGIIEKAEKMLCLPAKFDWADVGHFRTVKEIFSFSEKENLVRGNYLTLDGTGNLIYGPKDKLITTIGVNNTIVVDTGDVILVCDLSRAQDVKKLVEEIEKRRLEKFL